MLIVETGHLHIERGDHITQRERYKIILDYCENENYSLSGRMNGVCAATVKRVVTENLELFELLKERYSRKESGLRRLVHEKQEEILMIIANCLDILCDKDKLSAATVPQLTSCMGALLDNFCEENEAFKEDSFADDPLSKSLIELGAELKSD